jgi:DNA repair exonuclease SbcCD ATPase subunit
MENPEYLRSIIQKLKMEIKVLKAASLNSAASTPRPGITTDTVGTPTAEQPKLSLANRLSSSSSASGPTPGSLSGVDDVHNEDRALSPSPSRRLSHYQSRESISTDVSHGYLDAVQEENDDGFSDASSSARTTVVGMPTPKVSHDLPVASPARHNLPPLTIPPSLDSKSFEAFVEPVIEEYEKVISGLETHLAMTQAALNHSELILEEQQGRLDVVEDENRQLLQKHSSFIREASTPSPQQQQLQLELEQALKKVQAQLDDAEARRAESERAIQELESKLAAEQTKAQEQIQQLQQENEQQRAQSTAVTPLSQELSPAAQEKERELKAQTDKIRQLEEQVRILEDQVEADADALRTAKTAREVLTVGGHDGDETEETKREEELLVKLQSKASMELELEMEKSRHESLDAQVKAARKASQQSLNGSISDNEVSSQFDVDGDGEVVIRQLDVATHPSTTDPSISHSTAATSDAAEQIKKDLEEQLAAARESERLLKEETVALTEKLEMLQKDHLAALEMEEMLHLAVSDLEERLETSKETETKQLQELEQHLARIQDLETRSTKAEQEALQVVEELKTKLAEAKVVADERLADELLELLEKMEQERSKVEALQTQVENQLIELAAEKSRAAEIEADRAAIQAQWETDKERISVLEKNIEEQSGHVLEKTALIATLEARLVTLEGSLSEKELLHQELSQKVADHDLVLGSKGAAIKELEDQISSLKSELEVSDKTTKDQVVAVQSELTIAQAELLESQTRVQEQEQELLALREKMTSLESAATTAAETLAAQGAEHIEAVKTLESRIKLAEADRDEAETLLEEVERRHNAVDEQVKTLQNDVALHLTTIEILHGKLAQANNGSPPSSRPVSLSSSSTALAAGEDPAPIIQKLEKEKARYRALVRENEKEIERLSEDLESLASEFSNAATTFEDAEEEMKARITELEAIVEGRKSAVGLGVSLNNNNLSTTSLASSIASSFSTRNREGATANSALHPSSASTKTQVAALKAERDQALQSSEELSLIVADLNEKNHHLQERLLDLEREQESNKLNHVLERQAQQEEIRVLRERAERLDRNASPSPVGSHHHDDDLRSSVLQERILRHKTSTSSDAFGGAGLRGEDSLATPRQSWSTVASQQLQQQQQAGSPVRAGRHESTLIQQAKHIKLLEERIAELQASGGSPLLLADSRRGSISSPAIAGAAGVGLGIHHKSSDSDMTRSNTSPMLLKRASAEKMSPALRAMSTMGGPTAALPPTPPPTAPLPAPPAGGKTTPAHLTGSAPPSPRIGGVFTLETSSPGNSPSMRPSRTGSIGRVSNSLRRERDSTSSNLSDANGATNDTTNNGAISSATAQALQGVEVNELRGVVDTLAHQVQALKVEQTMQQGKIHRLEAALADAEEKLKQARTDVSTTTADRDRLSQELINLREELMAAKVKSDKDRAGLESILEKEKREREKAVETRAIMEARMEELMGRKSKFGCF